MDRVNSSVLAAAVIRALSAPRSSARQPDAATLGEAQVLAGGEWAIGRWEGYVTSVGTLASGNSGLNKDPRVLLINKDGNGKVTCRFAHPETSRPDGGNDEAVHNWTEWHLADHGHFIRN
jgi:hypothetical protein